MTLIVLSIITMVAISEIWLDPQKDRPLLEKYPLLAGILPILTGARDGLLRVSALSSAAEKALRALSDTIAALNTGFDNACRTFHAAITSCALVSDASQQTALEEIRDILLPDGLSCICLPQFDKLGVIEIALSQMTQEMEQTLATSTVNGKTLLQMFNEWTDTGEKLASALRQRELLSKSGAGDMVTPGDVRQAKNKWVQAAKTLVSLLELESEIPEDVCHRLLQPLLDAEAKHSRKKEESRNEETEDGKSGEPTDDDDDNPPNDDPSDNKGDDDNGNSESPVDSDDAPDDSPEDTPQPPAPPQG